MAEKFGHYLHQKINQLFYFQPQVQEPFMRRTRSTGRIKGRRQTFSSYLIIVKPVFMCM